MQPGESAAAPQASSGRQSSPTHRILVVEDDQDILQLNTAVLSQAGYLVETAANGAIAWDLLQLETFDLLVTDNEMPGMTGVELLKKLRAERMVLPIIMATGAEPREEFARDPWLRPAATLLKPYTLDELLGVVRVVLSSAEIEIARERVANPPNVQFAPASNGARPG
jgi:DNA-binding response OmpR family regulator